MPNRVFTSQNEQEMQGLFREFEYCLPQEYKEAAKMTILNQKALFTSSDWPQWHPEFLSDLEDNWIASTTFHIFNQGGLEYLLNKADTETFDHPAKAPDRMASIRRITGLARIALTSVLKLNWVHPLYKCYLFVISDREDDDEYPHSNHVEDEDGHQIQVFI